jgi:hypothetical protein
MNPPSRVYFPRLVEMRAGRNAGAFCISGHDSVLKIKPNRAAQPWVAAPFFTRRPSA